MSKRFLRERLHRSSGRLIASAARFLIASRKMHPHAALLAAEASVDRGIDRVMRKLTTGKEA